MLPRPKFPDPKEVLFKTVPDVFQKVVENIVSAPLRVKFLSEKLSKVIGHIPEVRVIKEKVKGLIKKTLLGLKGLRETLSQKIHLPEHLKKRGESLNALWKQYHTLTSLDDLP